MVKVIVKTMGRRVTDEVTVIVEGRSASKVIRDTNLG